MGRGGQRVHNETGRKKKKREEEKTFEKQATKGTQRNGIKKHESSELEQLIYARRKSLLYYQKLGYTQEKFCL